MLCSKRPLKFQVLDPIDPHKAEMFNIAPVCYF